MSLDIEEIVRPGDKIALVPYVSGEEPDKTYVSKVYDFAELLEEEEEEEIATLIDSFIEKYKDIFEYEDGASMWKEFKREEFLSAYDCFRKALERILSDD